MNRMKATKAAGAALALTLSAWIAHEGFTPNPVIPVKGDVPTIGHGATYYEDGSRVQMTDPPITRQRALELATWHLSSVYMKCVVNSLGEAKVYPEELKLAVDFSGQYGCGAWNRSPMLRAYLNEDYPRACEGYLNYKYMTNSKRLGSGWKPYKSRGRTRYKFDCSTPGNRTCRGVWARSLNRYKSCKALVE